MAKLYLRLSLLLISFTFLFATTGKLYAQCPVNPAFTFEKSCSEDYRINFTNNSSASPPGQIDYFQWHFGDATTSTATNPSHAYPSAGIYQVILYVYDTTGCYDSIIQNVTATAIPVASFTYTQTGCGEITFNNTSSYAGSNPAWFWTFGDGQISTSENPVHTYPTGGVKNISLTVTDEYGCSDTYFFAIAVFPPATVDFTYDQTNCELVQFFDNSTGTGMITRLWDFGDGFTSTLTNPSHTYVLGNTYIVTLTISDQYCNGLVYTDTLVFPDPPVAGFTFGPDGQCSSIPVNFDAGTSTGTNLNYSWDFGDGTTISGLLLPTTQYTYSSYNNAACDPTKAYNVELTVTDGIGCTDTATGLVSTQRIPRPLLIDMSGNNFQNCYSVNPSDPTDTLWVNNITPNMACITHLDISWGDGTDTLNLTATDFPLSHIYLTMGEFPLTVTAYGINGCVSDTTYVVANQVNPSVGISGVGANSGCAPYTATFVLHGYTGNSEGTTYIWDFDDGTTVTWDYNQPYINDTIEHVYTQSHCANPLASSQNGYIPSVMAVNACGTWTSTIQYITIFETPIANFTSVDTSNYGCFSDPFCFLNYTYHGFSTSCDSSVNYTWDFGDGNGSNQPEPCHSYAYPGTYQVNLLADNPLCGGTDTTITIHITGVHAGFTFDTVCVNSETHFTSLSWAYDDSSFLNNPAIVITDYFWDFGDGTNSILQNPNHIYPDTGTYSVSLTVTSEYGCDSTMIQDVYVDGLFIDNVIVDPITCYGTDDGAITVSLAGGIPIFTYTLFPGSITNTSGFFNNLVPGTYWILAQDAIGCWDETDTIYLIEPDTISVDSLQSTDISCNNDNDGTITTFASGGTTPLTFTLIPPGTSNGTGVFTSLAAGSYQVVVNDANGCPADTSFLVTISNPPPVIIDSLQSTSISCHNADDGFIQVWAQGGTGTLTYTLNPGGASNISGIFSGLGGGTYTVTVTDVNGCPATTPNINIINPAAIIISNVTHTNMSCHDTLDGTVTIVASGGSGMLTYTLLPTVIINNSGSFTGLGAGNYYVRINDMAGCADSTATITIINPGEILITSETVTAITCHNANNGIAEVTVSGGSTPYLYTLLPPGTTNGTGQFINLAAGTYYIIVEDANGCPSDTSNPLVIINPPELLIDSTQFADISCNGYDDGWIQVWASGGLGNLTYLITPGGVSNSSGLFNSLSANTYTITVTDTNACVVSTPGILITDPPGVNVSATHTDVTCFGYDDGTITIIATGGVGLLEYSIDNGFTYFSFSSFTALAPGNYIARVRDANGCETTGILLTVLEPALLQITGFTLITPSCAGCSDGQITANVNGGTMPYYHSWSNGMSGNPITGLPSGWYTDTLTDANGCQVIDSVFLNEPGPLSLYMDSSNVICYGDNTGWVVAIAGGGTTPYTYEWTKLPAPGIIGTNDTLFNCDAGFYAVTVYDFFNNILQDTIEVGQPDTLALTLLFSDTVCFGATNGWASVTAIGGIPPYTYLWSGGSGANTDSIYNLAAGTYTIAVTDQHGCQTIDSVTINENPELLVVASTSDTLICSGFSVQLNAAPSGGTFPVSSYHWTPVTGLSDPFIQSPVATPSASITYTVMIIDQRACVAFDSVTVIVVPSPTADFIYQNPCASNVVNFLNLSSPNGDTLASYDWDFGDGYFSSLQHPTHTYGTVDTTYTVSLIVQNANGCTDTIVQGVYVNPLLGLIAEADTVCIGSPTHFNDTVTNPAAVIISYFYDFGDGNTDTISDPVHQYALPGLYNVSVVVVDTSACTEATSFTVRVHALPFPDFMDSTSCINDITYFTDLTDTTAAGINSWLWDFGDGNASSQQHPVHLYTLASTYQVTLSIENTNGCIDSISKPVVVFSGPDAEFQTDTVCLGTPSHFIDLSTASSGVINSWFWSFGDGNTSTQQYPIHYYSSPGFYNVILIIGSTTGCTDTIMHVAGVNELPLADFIYDTPCEFGQTTFTDLSVPNADSLAIWYWDFGDGYTSNLQNPQHVFPAEGDYTVNLTVINSNGCPDDTSILVSVLPSPTADFNAASSCFNYATQFIDLSYSSVPIITWDWDFGDGNTSTAQNPVHTYALPGTYSVSLLVYDTNGCSSTISKSHTVYEGPEADFSADAVCLGEATVFDDLSISNGLPIIAWHWEFGDGNTSVLQHPVHVYAVPGTYSVTLTVTDLGACEDSISDNVEVDEIPAAMFSADAICVDHETSFTDLSMPAAEIVSWFWNFGDPASGLENYSYLQNPVHTYTQEGVYSVSLTATILGGCTHTTVQDITIEPPPIANFTFTNEHCVGEAVLFIDLSQTNNEIIDMWIWDFGDGTRDTIYHPATPNIEHTFMNPGQHLVTLTVRNIDGCFGSTSRPINILPVPIAAFDHSKSCEDLIVHFYDMTNQNGGGQVINWWWDFGDPLSGSTNNSQLQNPDHIFSGPGLYNVTLIAWNANSCRDTVIQVVDVQPKPPIDFYADAACEGELTQFYVNDTVVNVNTIVSYFWSFGDGTYSNLQNPQHLFAAWGTYEVTLTITDTSLCENSMTKEIMVDELPLAFFDITEPTCNGDSVFFNDLSSTTWGYIQTWVWDFDDGSPLDTIIFPDDPNVYHTYYGPGTYGATLTVINTQGCAHSFTREVEILATPTANFHWSANPCQNEAVHFTDASFPNGQGNILSWYWEFDDPISGVNNTSILQDPVHIFSQPGYYDVLLIVVNFTNCTDTMVKPVYVNASPDVAFLWDGLCEDTLTYFYPDSSVMNVSSVTSWHWDFGDGQYASVPAPSHNYENSGYYNVTLTIQDTGVCAGSRTEQILVNSVPIAFFDVLQVNCVGSPVYFDDLSSVPDSYLVEWHWDFGDGSDTTIYFPDIPDVAHTYLMEGTYPVTLTVMSADGCYAEEMQYVLIDASPIALFNYDPSCFSLPTQFWDNSSGGGGLVITSWLWDFGDPQSGVNNSSTLQNPEHIYSVPGVFDVLLTVVNVGGCMDTILQQVTVNDGEPVDFYAEDSCLHMQTYFYVDTTVTDTSVIQLYLWDFGDGGPTSTIMNPTHMYTEAGLYEVTLTIYDLLGCSNAVMHEVEVRDNPTALFEYEAACASDTAYFSDLSYTLNGDLIVAWYWDFDDPASGANNYSSLQDPMHVFTGTNNYDVKLLVTTDHGCQDSIVIPVAASSNPLSNYTYNINPCEPGLVYFSDSSVVSQSPITEWEWYMEPGSYSYVPDPHYIFLHIDTTYLVSLKVTDANGCSDMIVKPVFIPAGLEVELSSSQTCHLDPMHFSADILQPIQDSIFSYSWDFGEPASGPNNFSNLPEPEHTYLDPGYYTVSLIAVDIHGCEITVYKQVLVDNLPEPAFTYTGNLCDSIIYFTDMSSGNGAGIESWLWNYGDGSLPELIDTPPGNTQHFYVQEGTYTVTLTVTNTNGCLNAMSMEVKREPCLNSEFFVVSNTTCELNTVTFADSSGVDFLIEQWHWNFGDGTDTVYYTKTDSINHLYTAAGNYDVRLIVSAMFNNMFIADTSEQSVNIRPTPQSTFFCEPVCFGESTHFIDDTQHPGSYIESWSWNFGTGKPGDTSVFRNPVFKYDSAGTYDVSLVTVNQYGCLDSVRQEVWVDHIPIADFEYSPPCEGNQVHFIDRSDGFDSDIILWRWNFNDPVQIGDTSTQQNPSWMYTQQGTNTVRLIVENQNGCVDTAVYSVKVNNSPEAAFNLVRNYENLQGSVLLEDYSIGAIDYLWNFGDGYEIWDNNPPVSHVYDYEGEYLISLVVWNESGCPDSIFMDYEFMYKTLFIPNALAPASTDPEVQVFQPKGKNLREYYIAIYDSWGNLLWESDRLDAKGRPIDSWDGVYDGKLLPTDVYIWRARAVFRDGTFWEGNSVGNNEGSSGTTHGNVTLVR